MQASAPQPGRQRNRRGEGERLRAEIVTAAARLLTQQPSEALSLRAVAREVGVSAPALYLHFPDRRALMWAVLEERFAELTMIVTDAVGRAGDTRDRLRAWCVAYCRFGLEHPGHYRVLFESWAAERTDVPLAELPGHGLYQSLLAVLEPLSTNPEDQAVLLWAGLHGLVSLRINKPSFPWPPITELVDRLLRHLVPI
jgi:AcrR family transcriptional regulator